MIKIKNLTLILAASALLPACFYAYKPDGAVEVNKEKKGAFAVIGKTGAACGSSQESLAVLLDEAAADLHDVEDIAARNKAGNIAGFWVMPIDSGHEMSHEMSGDGTYIAGVEAGRKAEAPRGWVKYDVPKRKYLVVRCDHQTRGYFYLHMTDNFIPKAGYELTGPVQEFFRAGGLPGESYLYFPVKKKKKQADK